MSEDATELQNELQSIANDENLDHRTRADLIELARRLERDRGTEEALNLIQQSRTEIVEEELYMAPIQLFYDDTTIDVPTTEGHGTKLQYSAFPVFIKEDDRIRIPLNALDRNAGEFMVTVDTGNVAGYINTDDEGVDVSGNDLVITNPDLINLVDQAEHFVFHFTWDEKIPQDAQNEIEWLCKDSFRPEHCEHLTLDTEPLEPTDLERQVLDDYFDSIRNNRDHALASYSNSDLTNQAKDELIQYGKIRVEDGIRAGTVIAEMEDLKGSLISTYDGRSPSKIIEDRESVTLRLERYFDVLKEHGVAPAGAR